MGQSPEFGKKGYGGKKVIISDEYIVKAGDELLPLCFMCTKSRMTCDNEIVRFTLVPLESSDDASKEVFDHKRQEDDSFILVGTGCKFVNGVEAGIYKTEEDIPTPLVCDRFNPKEPG